MASIRSMKRNFAAGAILALAVLSGLVGPACGDISVAAGYCKISINHQMPALAPLVISPGSSEFLFPQTSDIVQVDLRQPIRLVCPGKKNFFSSSKLKSLQDINPHCVTSNVFSPMKGYVSEFSQLGCNKLAQAVAVSNGECLNNKYSRIQVGFDLPAGGFASTMNLCFNQKSYDPIFSAFTMSPHIVGRQHNISRPQFSPSTFYKGIEIDRLYKRDVQRGTLAQILGSETLAAKYIKNDAKYYLARGHLSAKADFVYGAEQHSTFFYMNTAPQWQIFNAGNWERLESSVRDYVGTRTSEVTVITGIWDKCTLPDVKGKQRPLYLYAEKNTTAISVPGYYWKVVYDPVKKEGAAFVGVNNPYLKNAEKSVFCKDVCDEFSWLQWDAKNVKLGYSFCCSLEDFRKTVTTAPDFKASRLLS